MLGVSQAVVSNVLTNGRGINPKLAEAMGYRKVVRFERVELVQDMGNETPDRTPGDDLPPIDLFGESVLRRSAVFVAGNRIKLKRWWAPGPRACVIGHNPSDAGEDRDDPTSLWWNRWFRHYGFGSYTAVNLYPFVTADPVECRRRANWSKTNDWAARDALFYVNLPEIISTAKQADQVFVCWGNLAIDHEWVDHVTESIQQGLAPYPDLWCWGQTKSGAPTHPMARGKHRLDPLASAQLWRAA